MFFGGRVVLQNGVGSPYTPAFFLGGLKRQLWFLYIKKCWLLTGRSNGESGEWRVVLGR